MHMTDSTEYARKLVQAVVTNRLPAFSVKEHNGKMRFVALASGAYGPDRDKHWVTEKALREWADEHQTGVRFNGERVAARWWHVGKPDVTTKSKGPGIDLGEVDAVAFHSHSLIMTGTFFDNRDGVAFAQKSNDLGLSICFFHPWDEPKENLFHNIDIFEVSFLPSQRASYPLTALAITEGVR